MTKGGNLSMMGEVIRNPKRLYLLEKFVEKKELNWTEIVSMLEEAFQQKLNPNTVSFHLKYLLERDLISKVGNCYVFNEKMEETVKKLVR